MPVKFRLSNLLFLQPPLLYLHDSHQGWHVFWVSTCGFGSCIRKMFIPLPQSIRNMKRLFTPVLLFCMLLLGPACSSLKSLGEYLSEADAANGIREALIIGANLGSNSLSQKGSFSRDVLMKAVLPAEAQTIVQTLDRLGLATEFNRFANTVDNAAIEAAKRSGPIFIDGIRRMSIRDAINIVKNGGTAATDYLRNSIGDSLRGAVRPVMRDALNEYNIISSWDKLVAPAKLLLGNRLALNLDIDNILAVMITNEMFKKVAEQEVNIRTNAAARTSSTLQRVFGREWK
jgi:hypothetical protein